MRVVEEDYRRGVWAVHRTMLRGGELALGDSFTVTHVPTGACLTRHLTCTLAKAVADALPETWAEHAGFGMKGVISARNRKDADDVARIAEGLGAKLCLASEND